MQDYFIFYKPKDIVSGDFYWFHTQGSKKYITVVDCTGHGVPGAFMSIIGHNSLNKIVKENGHTKPADILDRLNEEVVNTLMNQPDEDVKDGIIIKPLRKNVDVELIRRLFKEHVDRLKKLKDRVEPTPGELAKSYLEEEFED